MFYTYLLAMWVFYYQPFTFQYAPAPHVTESLKGISLTPIHIWAGGETMERGVLEDSIGRVLDSLHGLSFDKVGYKKLLVETMAYESERGTFIKQKGGPALGVYQIEPSTHRYVVKDWLERKGEDREILKKALKRWTLKGVKNSYNITKNIHYQTLVAFLVYYHRVGGFPALTTLKDRATLYKKHYNTYKGKGTVRGYIEKAHEYKVCEEAAGGEGIKRYIPNTKVPLRKKQNAPDIYAVVQDKMKRQHRIPQRCSSNGYRYIISHTVKVIRRRKHG